MSLPSEWADLPKKKNSPRPQGPHRVFKRKRKLELSNKKIKQFFDNTLTINENDHHTFGLIFAVV